MYIYDCSQSLHFSNNIQLFMSYNIPTINLIPNLNTKLKVKGERQKGKQRKM